MIMSDCVYRNEDGTCGCEGCMWFEEDVECEPDECERYSPCEIYEEDIDEERD